MKGATALAEDRLRCSYPRTASATVIRTGVESTSEEVSDFQLSEFLQTTAPSQCPTCCLCTRIGSANSGHQLQAMTCKSSCCTRTHSLSACRSSSLRTSSKLSILNLSLLIKQLRLLSFLTLLSVSLFSQVDTATARAIQQGEDGGGVNLPERCRLPFSSYSCGGFRETRYTYKNGSCHNVIEWTGVGCEHDGTENSFATEEECQEVCIPRIPTTSGPTLDGAVSLSETSTVDTSVCFLPVGDFDSCFIITFPTNYYFYNQERQECESKVSFCPINRPGIFESMQECLNKCERPLAPTQPPPTTTEPETTRPHPPTTTIPRPPATTDYTTARLESSTYTSEVFSTRKSTTELLDRTVSTTHPTNNRVYQEATTTVQLPRTTQGQTPPTTENHPRLTTTETTISTTMEEPSVVTDGVGVSIFRLNNFDLASMGLGVVAFLLIFVLVGVVTLSLYKRHVMLRRQKQEVMDSKKTAEVRTLAFTPSRHDQAVRTNKHNSNTSMSTTSTVSSYLTTV